MSTLVELVRSHAGFDGSRLAHLSRLVASWRPLADLCFADLLLYVPIAEDPPGRLVVVSQIRPSTSQTVHHLDMVGTVVDERERPVLARAFATGEVADGEVNLGPALERVRVKAVPVRWEGEVIAICSRESAPSIGRRLGELERTYTAVFDRFVLMIAAGSFPFGAEDAETEEAPRVGDGVLVLDAEGRVTFASPNAVSALHRLGVHANAQGCRLGELALEEMVVHTAFTIGAPVTEEIERGPDVTVLVRCLPLLEEARVDGALVLIRDVSDLRRRDRLLVSMDATIREIHHRVKNNLQTVSSLLRLQGRRLDVPEARQAIEESVRRIYSIALVHDILSREAGDDVSFGDIVRPLVRMVEEGLVDSGRGVRVDVEGDGGRLPARVATPMAVVLTELLQNALDHGFPSPLAGGGRVVVALGNDTKELVVRVADDGIGLPPGFALDRAQGLGLSIVRSLVTTQLGGTLALDAGAGPRPAGRPGTTLEVRVPLGLDEGDELASLTRPGPSGGRG